ncbi:MAG: nitroreductase family protein [Anaerolineae bacterium]|nr:nitroreductase family protein [Anaerolineae bacterium]
MDFLELVRQRYSVRAYKPDPVEDEKLQLILEAARLAPTAANRQPFRILVIPTAEHRAVLQQIYSQKWFVDAPLVLCVCGVEAEAWVRRHDGVNYVDVDAAIVMDHIVLAATSLGLGTCWIGAFNPDAAHEGLKLPSGIDPVAFTPLGYPDDRPSPKRRKELSDIVRYGPW